MTLDCEGECKIHKTCYKHWKNTKDQDDLSICPVCKPTAKPCSVCKKPLTEQYGPLKTLKCKCVFHETCMELWKKQNPSPEAECPDCCSICHKSLANGMDTFKVKCQCVFHKTCLEKWRAEKRIRFDQCFICKNNTVKRDPIAVDEEDDPEDFDSEDISDAEEEKKKNPKKLNQAKSVELSARQLTMQASRQSTMGLLKKKTFAIGTNPDDMQYATMRTVITRQTTTVDDKTGQVLEQKVEQFIEEDSDEDLEDNPNPTAFIPDDSMTMIDNRTGKTYNINI